jgi:hypothetical protein
MGFTNFIKGLIEIFKSLKAEFTGKTDAKFAALINILMLFFTLVLIILVIFPSLLAQFGFNNENLNPGILITSLILFVLTGILSGYFIHRFKIEDDAFRN